MGFKMAGVEQVGLGDMGFLLAFLKDPSERKPIAQVCGELMGAFSQRVPGAIGAFRPQPVLSISTGATSNQQGQFAYSLSGIDPQEVYAVSRRCESKITENTCFV